MSETVVIKGGSSSLITKSGPEVFDFKKGQKPVLWNYTVMNKRFLSFAEEFRRIYTQKPFVTDAWRDKNDPLERGKDEPGAHTYGSAIDIRFPLQVIDQRTKGLFLDFITSQGFTGIGFYNWGVHLDYGYPGKTGKRAWSADSIKGQSPLSKEDNQLYQNVLLRWRGGSDPFVKDSNAITDITENHIKTPNEDPNLDYPVPFHAVAKKDREIVEGEEDVIPDYNFNFNFGKLLFGDLFLHIPPTNINVAAHNQTFNFETIRTAGNPTIATDSEVININLDLFFANTNSINNELRRILAMYIRTPFITLENEFLSKALKKIHDKDLFSRSIPVALNSITLSTIPGFPNSIQATLTLNEFESKILTPEFKYLVTDDDVVSQNNLFLDYGKKTTEDFKDKIVLSSNKKAYKSLPFMKYYQSLLYNDKGPVLDPNGDILKTKDNKRVDVYEEDKTFYKVKKYLPKYIEESNTKYKLKFFEANIDFVEERKKNREQFKNRLNTLIEIQNLMREAGLLDFFEYDPEKPNDGIVSRAFEELKLTLDNLGNNTFNIIREIVGNINDAKVRHMYEEVIQPTLILKFKELENTPVGKNTPKTIIKDSRFFQVDHKAKTFPELLNFFNQKYNSNTDLDNPALSNDFKFTINIIFNGITKYLEREIEKQSILIHEPIEIILGDKQSTITNITATFSNKLIPIHLEFWQKPAYQHMGSNDWEFTMSIRSTNEDKVREIREMIEKYKTTARKVMNLRPELIYKNLAYIDFNDKDNSGSLIDMLGIKRAVIIDYNFNTVENQPGTTDIILRFKQADLTYDAYEKLERDAASPDDLIKYLKDFFKHCFWQESNNQVYLLEPKEEFKTLRPLYDKRSLPPRLLIDHPDFNFIFSLANNKIDDYLTNIYLYANSEEIKAKNENDPIRNLRYKYEKQKRVISDDFIIKIVREYQTLADQIAKTDIPAGIRLTIKLLTLPFGPIINPIAQLALKKVSVRSFVKALGTISGPILGPLLFPQVIDNLTTKTPAELISYFKKIYKHILDYFNDTRLETTIWEFINDPSFKDFMKQVRDPKLNDLYEDWKTKQIDSLRSNYPDLYLPVFPNNKSELDNVIYTPPDFYFKSYSFINKSFINDLEDLIRNEFDIQTNLYALNGRINYEQYISLKNYIDQNKELLLETASKANFDNMEEVFRKAKGFSEDFYKNLYNAEQSTNKTVDSREIIPIIEVEEYFLLVMKNLLLQRYKGSNIAQAIPEGTLGEAIKDKLNKLDRILIRREADDKKVDNTEKQDDNVSQEVRIESDPQKILGSLMRNVNDLKFLNLVPDPKKDTDFIEKTNSLQSYWGYNVKVAEKEINRLERINNARTHSNLLRLGRAFPAFKLYFIEEDNNELLYFDDFYSYSAINSIEIISNKNAASDTAVIRLSNLSNRLTNDKAEVLNSESFLDGKNPKKEQKVESLMLKPGINMMIKMGYSNNPMELEILFQGVITEVQPGQIVEIICQSYGNQLNTLIDAENINYKSLAKQFGDIATLILNKIPGLNKLGKYSPISAGTSDPLRTPGNLWFRGLQGKFNMASFITGLDVGDFNLNDPRDDNIYLQYTTDKSIWNNLTFDWRIFNQTAWSAIQEILLFHPDYISRVLPYNENFIPGQGNIRQTLYIGPKSGAYKYTDSFGVVSNRIKDIEWINRIEKYRTSYNRSLSILNNINRLKSGVQQGVATFEDQLDRFKITKLTAVDRKRIDELIKTATALIVILESRFFGNINFPSFTGFDFNSIFDKVRWIDTNIDALKRLSSATKADFRKNDSALEYLYNQNWRLNPQYKPVRKDHIINSFYHIIKNNVSASSEQIFNKVVMTFPKNEPVFSREELSQNDIRTYEVMVDDSINDESIKEYHTFQKNIDTNSFDLISSTLNLVNKKTWFYNPKRSRIPSLRNPDAWQKYPTFMRVAMNILAKQMERMYVGDLVLWGNPQIRPWDVLHIDDIVTDMKGSFEVEQVIHRFDAQTGFITLVRPNLITHVQDPDNMYDESVVNSVMTIASKKGLWSAIGNAVLPFEFPAGLLFGISGIGSFGALNKAASFTGVDKASSLLLSKIGLSGVAKAIPPVAIIGGLLYGGYKGFATYSNFIVDSIGKLYGRNAIWFAPVQHKGKPYVAGLDGYKEDTYFQHVIHKMKDTNFINRLGYANSPLDAYLIDGKDVNPLTYFKTLFYGRDINDGSSGKNKKSINER